MKNRLFLYFMGWVSLVDDIVYILSFTFYYPGLYFKMARWNLHRKINKRKKNGQK